MWVTPLHDVRSVFKFRDLMWVTPQKMHVTPCNVRTASNIFKLNTYSTPSNIFVCNTMKQLNAMAYSHVLLGKCKYKLIRYCVLPVLCQTV